MSNLDLSRQQIVQYAFTPQIWPRLKKLFGSGFINLPYFVAVVFYNLKIIPDGHPFLQSANQGGYSFLQVLAAAANNITFDKHNIDKISVFVVILSGIAMFFVQLLLLLLALIAMPAYAYSGPGVGPATASGFFSNPNNKDDIAFRLLDLIFGVPGIFDSSNAGTTPFHTGFHALLQFYSFGIMLVGVFVIVYLVTAVVFETAKTGVPFGRRFNHAWAPFRVILFFGLLLPTGSGLNLAQYTLLISAKLGSNVATNAWTLFDTTTTSAYLGTPSQLIASPITPDLDSLAAFMVLARTCSWAEGRMGLTIKPYFVYGPGSANATDISGAIPAFADMVKKAKGDSIIIRFGEQDDAKYGSELGGVFPYCGELSMTIVDQSQPGAAYMQETYIQMVGCLWDGPGLGGRHCYFGGFNDYGRAYTARYSRAPPHNPFPNMTPYEGDTQKTQVIVLMNQGLDEALVEAINRQTSGVSWANTPSLKLGWGGAGIWFNKIAEQNGAITAAAYAKPEPRRLPHVMEIIRKQKQINDAGVPLEEMYTPTLSSGRPIAFEAPYQRDVAVVLNQVYKYWGSASSNAFFSALPVTRNQEATGNAIIDSINLLMGTRGLFDMCKNTDVHPLAQLSSLGKGLVEHSIRAFGFAAGVGVTTGLLAILKKLELAQALSGATSFVITFASIGLVLGFVLFYVLPFMPFIYFFFAVMTWCKGIFEAMVGMPLWALAHLKIDGEGMPGHAAVSGYFYILEIFIRPICILLGFLGGIAVFTAMVKVLNNIFYLVLSNLTGHEDAGIGGLGCFNAPSLTATPGGPDEQDFKRGTIDEFFYTVIYAIIVYMIGIPCFKMVDLVPDNIMRWMGSGIKSFGANDGDPADQLLRNVTVGAGALGKQLQEGGGKAMKSFGFGS